MRARTHRGSCSVAALLLVVGCGGVETRTRGTLPHSGDLRVEAGSPRVCSIVSGALREAGADVAGPNGAPAHLLRVDLEVVSIPGGEPNEGIATPSSAGRSYEGSAQDPITWIYAAWVLATGLASVDADQMDFAERSRNPNGGPLVTLTLTMVDRQNGRELWRGVAREQIRDWRDPSRNREWIAKTVLALVKTSD